MRRIHRFSVAWALALWASAAAGGGPPEPVDPAARLPRGNDASEHWDLAAHFDTGHRLYARFLITNEGPGDRTAVAVGHLIEPDGQVVAFRNGRRDGAWKLRDGGRHIEIGSSVLAFDETERRFEVDNDKRGIKVRFVLPAETGLAAPEGSVPGRLDLLNLASPATGSVWVTGMNAPLAVSGRALLTHSWSERPPSDGPNRRIDFASFDDEALFLTSSQIPAGTARTWLAIATEAGLASRPDVTIEARLAEEEVGPYPIPRRLEMRGKALDGSIALGDSPVLVTDPLDALPTLLKMVYSFGGRPRHIWTDATASVAIGSRSGSSRRHIESPGIAVLFFSDATL